MINDNDDDDGDDNHEEKGVSSVIVMFFPALSGARLFGHYLAGGHCSVIQAEFICSCKKNGGSFLPS